MPMWLLLALAIWLSLSVGFVAGTVWTGYFRQEGER